MAVSRITTGVTGLDEIVNGGLPQGFNYLILGPPGTGKTTIGLQFLLEGRRLGEKCLCVLASETKSVIDSIAQSHGFDLNGIEFLELNWSGTAAQIADQTLFEAADMELPRKTDTMLRTIQKVQPQRLVFDSIAEIRLLSETPLRYRLQVLRLKSFLTGKNCTSLILDTPVELGTEKDLQDVMYGSISLHVTEPQYGSFRNLLKIDKILGSKFVGGFHNYRIEDEGVIVFPRPQLKTSSRIPVYSKIVSGNDALDSMLGGGLEEGTSCLILGQSGTGKSTIATMYAFSAAQKGQHSALFIFDERVDTYIYRSQSIGINIQPFVNQKIIELIQIDAGEISPGEFAAQVKNRVENNAAKIIVLDSINGYFHAMPDRAVLPIHLHELISYLSDQRVMSILTLAPQGVLISQEEQIPVSYLIDTLVDIRHFEAFGQLKLAISVVKKRHGSHEHSIREMQISQNGIKIGRPLEDFSGVLTGTPKFEGTREELIKDADV